jgi:hypothetical protein
MYESANGKCRSYCCKKKFFQRVMGWEGLQVPAYSYPLSAPPTSPSWAGRRKTGTAFEVKFKDVNQCDMLETTE